MISILISLWFLSCPIKASLLEYSLPDEIKETSISSQHGSVEGDAFVYYTIRFASKSPGKSGVFQRIELRSLEGDADLYISSNHRPTWAK